jgi:hypothetical protein
MDMGSLAINRMDAGTDKGGCLIEKNDGVTFTHLHAWLLPHRCCGDVSGDLKCSPHPQ